MLHNRTVYPVAWLCGVFLRVCVSVFVRVPNCVCICVFVCVKQHSLQWEVQHWVAPGESVGL